MVLNLANLDGSDQWLDCYVSTTVRCCLCTSCLCAGPIGMDNNRFGQQPFRWTTTVSIGYFLLPSLQLPWCAHWHPGVAHCARRHRSQAEVWRDVYLILDADAARVHPDS
eukprot:SAG22_NODE_9701_length_574_cov_1.193684_1_plen_109_part_10